MYNKAIRVQKKIFPIIFPLNLFFTLQVTKKSLVRYPDQTSKEGKITSSLGLIFKAPEYFYHGSARAVCVVKVSGHRELSRPLKLVLDTRKSAAYNTLRNKGQGGLLSLTFGQTLAVHHQIGKYWIFDTICVVKIVLFNTLRNKGQGGLLLLTLGQTLAVHHQIGKYWIFDTICVEKIVLFITIKVIRTLNRFKILYFVKRLKIVKSPVKLCTAVLYYQAYLCIW